MQCCRGFFKRDFFRQERRRRIAGCAFSTSTEPRRRSSSTLSGTCTNGHSITSVSNSEMSFPDFCSLCGPGPSQAVSLPCRISCCQREPGLEGVTAQAWGAGRRMACGVECKEGRAGGRDRDALSLEEVVLLIAVGIDVVGRALDHLDGREQPVRAPPVSHWAPASPPLSTAVALVGRASKRMGFMQGQSGARLWSARAITDLPVPRPPAMTTPPMSGFTAARRSAVLMGVCPTTSESGKACFAIELSLKPLPDSASRAAVARSSAANSPSSQFSVSAHVGDTGSQVLHEMSGEGVLTRLVFHGTRHRPSCRLLRTKGPGLSFCRILAYHPKQFGPGAEHRKVDGAKVVWNGGTGEL